MIQTQNEELEELAIQWFIRSREPMSPVETHEMQIWLSFPEHKAAYEEVQSTWDTLDILKSPLKSTLPINTPPLSRRAFLYTAASALASVGVYGIYQRYITTPVFSRTFISCPGEMVESTLPDGTHIALDTDTKLEVTYYTHKRETHLAYGQVMFKVASNVQKPFTVNANDTRVTVVGTRFSVRNFDNEVKVAVQEGHVKVDTASSPTTIDLLAADGVTINQTLHQIEKIKVTPQMVGLWQYGRVAFEDATLSEALKEFARYGEKRLIASKEVSNIRITGSFDITYAGNFVKALPTIAPIRYLPQGEHILILPR